MGGASQRIADFFAVAPAIGAPVPFTGGRMVDLFARGIFLLVVVFGWAGGMKRLEMSRSRCWRLARSVAMVSSRHWRRFVVAFVDS